MRAAPGGTAHSSAASRSAAPAADSWLSRAPPGGPQVPACWVQSARRMSSTLVCPSGPGAQVSSPAAPCLPQ